MYVPLFRVLIKEDNKLCESESTLEQLYFSAFTIPADGDDGEWMRAIEILAVLQQLPTFNRSRDNNAMRLGKVLIKIGLKSRRGHTGTYYWVKREEM